MDYTRTITLSITMLAMLVGAIVATIYVTPSP